MVVSLFLILNFSIGVSASTNYDRQEADTCITISQRLSVKGGSGGKVKTYQTYTKTNPQTGEVYSGRTSGYGTPTENVRARDRGHHMNDNGFGPAVLDKSSTNYNAIRGREQLLIKKMVELNQLEEHQVMLLME